MNQIFRSLQPWQRFGTIPGLLPLCHKGSLVKGSFKGTYIVYANWHNIVNCCKGYIDLCTYYQGIPPAFTFPEDKNRFLNFRTNHPDKIFMQKGGAHRGFKMLSANQVDLTESEDNFVQVLKKLGYGTEIRTWRVL